MVCGHSIHFRSNRCGQIGTAELSKKVSIGRANLRCQSRAEQIGITEIKIEKGVILSQQSSCGMPILFAKKKDSLLHLCIDWQGLNTITKKDHYPLLLIPNLLDCLHHSNVFTKIDLQGAYNLICIAPGDEWKTTFCTCYSSFDFMVMHFGLTNTPATFQHYMNSVFSNVLDKFIIIYLDNILIFLGTPKNTRNMSAKSSPAFKSINFMLNPRSANSLSTPLNSLASSSPRLASQWPRQRLTQSSNG
jgi:hypothetical protein